MGSITYHIIKSIRKGTLLRSNDFGSGGVILGRNKV